MRIFYLLLLLPLLAGCLPSAGPSKSRVIETGQLSKPPFAIVELNQPVSDFLASQEPASFASTFGMGSGAPAITLGVGDMVAVSIFEAASGGLFSGETGTLGGGTKSVKLPEQPVSRNGTLSIPYVGQVRAAGLTPVEVQRAIEAALKDKAIEPQVIVTVTQSPSTFVTVAGDVKKAGRLPLNLGGDRVLDVIASSGGTADADYNTFVRLTRGGSSATVSLARVVRDNSQNIYLRPNDLLYVYTDAQTYSAFGATLRNATVAFNSDRLTLAEAVGQSGGINDLRADARGVFVFRYENPEYVDALLRASSDTIGDPDITSAGIPVVYRLDFSDPRGFFAAQRFLMRDNDVLYVSNAASTDLQKLLSVFTGGLGTAGAGVALTNNLTD